ncbi:M3 peptidase [Helicosporidium sp. ATCC 50920]|nr:M3 peptidase [Helicosporidium sp. ATCC 50920]|eukprot:KDD76574.1 M3 peptidase [Helicosporidium sp. ATCC 50920]
MLPGLDELESETNATWGKIVEPLELLHDSYERVTSVFELLATVNHTLGMDVAVAQAQALATNFTRRLQQSTALYASLSRIRSRATAWLDHSLSQMRVLDHWLAKMEEQGAKLNSAKKADLKRLDDEETELKRQFADNVAYGTAAFQLMLRDGTNLRGVPHSTRAAMAAAARERNLSYWRSWPGVTQPAPSLPPRDGASPTPEWGPWVLTFDPWLFNSMMSHCPNPRLRRIIFQSYENRASQAPWDNVPVVERLLRVRHSRARLLGAASYAELVGRRRMASPHQVNKALDELLAPVASAAVRSVLRMVRLMVDSEAKGEDVWGDKHRLNDLHFNLYPGARLALGRYSEVSPKSNNSQTHYTVQFMGSSMQSYGVSLQPVSPISRVNVEALEYAERVMQNTTLSQPDCVALLANVTTHFGKWQIPYWLRRLESLDSSKDASFDIGEYFTLSRVLSGVFGLLHRLWGMHVVESIDDKPPVWHPDVRYFRLFNGTELLGSFYLDPFARPDKFSVPYTYSLVKRSEAHGPLPGKVRTPIAVLSTFIKAPVSGEPALLTISDVRDIFHEFGHVVQILTNQINEVLMAGTTALPLDFLEVFAQFYEMWATENHTLSMMAQNYRTHAELAEDRRKELVQSMRRMRPLEALEQLYKSRMDLSLHSDYSANATHTILTHRQKIARSTLVLPYSTNNCDICSLVHCFAYEYAAGYYSYLWSEVHASDAMGYFEEVGTSNDTQVRALGNKMAAVLLRDGMSNAAESQYEKFRGRSASAEHFVAQLKMRLLM